MKRIINGVTYNTETATQVAKHEFDNTEIDGSSGTQILYETQGGAFFLHNYQRSVRVDEADPELRRVREINGFTPMTREDAQHWIMTGDVEVFSDIFGDPPEAVAETSPEATLYVRVPTALKDRIEAEAKAAGQTVNAWALHRLESGIAS